MIVASHCGKAGNHFGNPVVSIRSYGPAAAPLG